MFAPIALVRADLILYSRLFMDACVNLASLQDDFLVHMYHTHSNGLRCCLYNDFLYSRLYSKSQSTDDIAVFTKACDAMVEAWGGGLSSHGVAGDVRAGQTFAKFYSVFGEVAIRRNNSEISVRWAFVPCVGLLVRKQVDQKLGISSHLRVPETRFGARYSPPTASHTTEAPHAN